MTDFSEFMTMKLIAEKRMRQHGMSDNIRLPLLEGAKLTKNLNVRVPIHLIGQVEVLAQWLQMSKAELVMEILESGISEAFELISKEGFEENYWSNFYDHMEKNFGAILNRDENGKVTSFNYSEKSKSEE